ncbi:MAG: hypothetical protein HY264_01630 [Chloroflexi bacterium]|nr:hypothetical protein [Chloroflexota bacterium]
MSLLGTLFGGTRRPPSRDDQIIALSTASVTLQAELGLVPAGQAGLVIRPIDSEAYRRAEAELAGLLEIAGRETGATITERSDAYGYRWVVIADDSIADLVSTAYSVSIQLRDAGFGDQVLAAVFGFADGSAKHVFWLYNFKRAAFYPFVPQPDGATRDTAHELQLAAALGRELRVEPDQARWYPMWAMPLDGTPPARPASAGASRSATADQHERAPAGPGQDTASDHKAGRGSGGDNAAGERDGC